MSIVKWSKPYSNNANGELIFRTPFASLMENFFNENDFGKEFSNFMPAVNVAEDEKGFHLELSAPGFKKEDFKLAIEQKVITISGEHKEEKNEESKKFTRKEFNYGTFRRSFTLPETVNEEKIEAKYENGILQITLPKKEEEKSKLMREITIG